jgi:hypothetical protein
MIGSIDPEAPRRARSTSSGTSAAKTCWRLAAAAAGMTWRYADMAATVLGLDPWQGDIQWAQTHTPALL